MQDEGNTKAQFIYELRSLRLQIHQSEAVIDPELADQRPVQAMADARLFYSLASVAASQTSSDEALQQCLDIVCEYLGWPVGHLYVEASDGTGELAPTTVWHLDNPQEFETFRTVTEQTRFAPGVGLPGRVLSSGEPAWIPDVITDRDLPRNKLATELGVHGALGFPIKLGAQTVAVLEFFTTTRADPDDHVLNIMRIVGPQFSRILERMRAEEALKKAHDELQKRVEERTSQLATSNESLKKEIAERVQAEEALRESVELYRAVVDNANDAISIIIGESRIFVNKAYLELYGLKDISQAVGVPVDEFVQSPEEKGMVREPYRSRQQGNLVPGTYEYHIRRADGEVRTVETSAVFISYKGQLATLAVIRDSTDRRRLEQQLIHADRLVAIGTLVSGVAHEVNNPLSGAMGRADLLLRDELEDGLRRDLQVIRDEIQRASTTLRSLLTFARAYEAEKSYISINEVLENVLEVRAYALRVNNVEVDKDLSHDLPWTMADPQQLRQVFLNIIVNAEHAMAETQGIGVLSVKTGRVGETIHMTIGDNGPGMLEEIRARIFDPFFTTKPIGTGTGLGLSISHGIIQQHGGDIQVASEVGKGTTFTIELPVLTES